MQPTSLSSPQDPTADAAAADAKALADLRPIFELEKITARVLEDMGLGAVTSSTEISGDPDKFDFCVLHFVILPQRSAWLDFMLETDRASARKIFEMFSGTSEATDADLEDMLRETMNLLHGSMKAAFKGAGVDVIIPLVPQSIAAHKVTGAPGGFSLHSRHVFKLEGITLRLTLIARVAPITRKQLKSFRLAEVLIEPLAPRGAEDQLPIVKRHTLLNKRLLQKVQTMAEFESEATTHAIIEPSPLAQLLPND
jgi:hypothetical protein